MAALASLTANYTDSEDEDDQKEPEKAEEDKRATSVTPAAASSLSSSNSTASTPTKQRKRLVSYAEVEAEDDDEEDKEEPTQDNADQVVDMDLESDADAEETKDEAVKSESKDEAENLNESGQSFVQVEAWTEGVKLPPKVPEGVKCDPALQERINRLYKRKMETGFDMNAIIQNKKAFRNPSIYEKLIQFCDIDETGTNLPKDLYDGHLFGKESHYDELAKVQTAEMERREKLRAKVASKPPQASHKVDVDAGRRKTKWDQQQPANATSSSSSRPATKPSALPKVAVPQVVSAAAAKSISAFGPLKK